MNFKKITLALTALVALNGCAPALGHKRVVIQNNVINQSVEYESETAREYAEDIAKGAGIGALEGIITAVFAACIANKFSPENKGGKLLVMGLVATLFSKLDIIAKTKSAWNWIWGKQSGPKYVTRESTRKNVRNATILCTLLAATNYDVDKYATPLYDGTKLLCYDTPKLLLYDAPKAVISGCVSACNYAKNTRAYSYTKDSCVAVKDSCVAVGNYVKNTKAGSLFINGPFDV